LIKLSSEAETAGGIIDNVFDTSVLSEDAYRLACQIYKSERQAGEFAGQLSDVCAGIEGKDFLIVHNPGGWGHARTDRCLEWEKSIVNGVIAVIEKMEYSLFATQYFRSREEWRGEIADLKEQLRFFPNKAGIMAAWLRFIISHVDDIKIVLVGVSQGAGFGNAVMQRLGDSYPVYSIELGFPFIYSSRRRNNERILAIDGNGVEPDKLVQGTALDAAGIFMVAPFKWLVHHLKGDNVLFSHCVNTPGHEYDWSNPEVEGRITDFLESNFARRKQDKQESFGR
jgi:pimeloyl-ACP methyl ester carboxylesterase